jgi:hypothetical protein
MCQQDNHETRLIMKHGAYVPLPGGRHMASVGQPDRSAPLAGDTSAVAAPGVQTSASALAPWVQLVAGVICMAMIANLQYGWTIFVTPIDAKHHWGKAAIQGTFTLFILLASARALW